MKLLLAAFQRPFFAQILSHCLRFETEYGLKIGGAHIYCDPELQ